MQILWFLLWLMMTHIRTLKINLVQLRIRHGYTFLMVGWMEVHTSDKKKKVCKCIDSLHWAPTMSESLAVNGLGEMRPNVPWKVLSSEENAHQQEGIMTRLTFYNRRSKRSQSSSRTNMCDSQVCCLWLHSVFKAMNHVSKLTEKIHIQIGIYVDPQS